MKLYISYFLTFSLLTVPLMATDDAATGDDKTVQVQKEVAQHDDEASSAPVAKKIAQTLWKHKGKVAVGVSVIALMALAYWYHDTLAALLGCDAKPIENNTNKEVPTNQTNAVKEIKVDTPQINTEAAQAQASKQEIVQEVPTTTQQSMQAAQPEVQQPSVENNTTPVVTEPVESIGDRAYAGTRVALADAMASDSTPHFIVFADGTQVAVMPLPVVLEAIATSAKPNPVVPLTVSEATPTTPLQESAQIPNIPLSEAPVAVDTDAELANSGNPWNVFEWLSKITQLLPTTETPTAAEAVTTTAIPATPSVDQTISGDQQS